MEEGKPDEKSRHTNNMLQSAKEGCGMKSDHYVDN